MSLTTVEKDAPEQRTQTFEEVVSGFSFSDHSSVIAQAGFGLPALPKSVTFDYRQDVGSVVDDSLFLVVAEVDDGLSGQEPLGTIGKHAALAAKESAVLRPAKIVEVAAARAALAAVNAGRSDVASMNSRSLCSQVRQGVLSSYDYVSPEAAVWYRDANITGAAAIVAFAHEHPETFELAEHGEFLSVLGEEAKVLTGHEIAALIESVRKSYDPSQPLESNIANAVSAIVLNGLKNDSLF